MAKDTKTISVHPNNEVSAISFFQNFGWELFGNQEVKTSSSHLKESMWTGDIVQVTETSHYIKLTFQREKSMPNYSRLVQLENEYNLVTSPTKPTKPSLMMTIIMLVVGIPIMLMLENIAVLLILGFLLWLAIIPFYIWRRFPVYRKKLAEYESAEAIELEQKRKILSECQSLLS